MTSEIMDVARNNQIFKIFLHGVPRRNFRFDLRKKTVLLLAEICAHSKASNFVLGRLPWHVKSLLLHNIKHRPTA